ncbi:MAG: DNRLRE domain-containing protein [Syntrophomonadaceae bacterium]
MATVVFTPIDNVYISQFYSNQNFWGSSDLFCGQFHGSTDIYRVLLRFDLSSIPALSTINDARLKLYIARNYAPDISKQINVWAALNEYVEFRVTFANQPPIGAIPDSSITITNELSTYLEFDLTALVRQWHSGTVPNNGIMVSGLETADALVDFLSKEYNNSSVWPLLEIDYTKGVNIEYPVENVTTAETWQGSSAIPLGPRTVSFTVVNIGDTNDAAVGLEISPDGVTWSWVAFLITSGVIILTPLPASGYTGDSALVFNTTGYTGAYARITYVRRDGHGPTTLAIYPTATEA